MPKAARELSVAELERILNAKKSELESLVQKRDKLRKELSAVEEKISQIQGNRMAGVQGRSKPKQRPKNSKPLHDYVTEILAKNKKGLTLADLSQQVLQSGYKTNSTNFKNTLYQCLYNSKSVIHNPKTGNYQLKQ